MEIINKIKNLFEVVRKGSKQSGYCAVIVAAGSSSRMDGINKVFADINDVPVVIRAALAFEECDKIEKIIIVARQEDIIDISTLCRENYIQKVSKIVTGGDSREKSVLEGLKEVPEGCALVAVHDGARPLVESADIERVISQAEACGGAILGVLVKDTVKEVSSDNTVIKTLPRENLFLAQTPQVFNPGVLKNAIEAALSEGLLFTDDSAYVEHYYAKIGSANTVKLVPGNYENIKITTPEDLLTAQGIASSREF